MFDSKNLLNVSQLKVSHSHYTTVYVVQSPIFIPIRHWYYGYNPPHVVDYSHKTIGLEHFKLEPHQQADRS